MATFIAQERERASHNHNGKIAFNWAEQRYQKLAELGWVFTPNQGNAAILPKGHVATYDAPTPDLLKSWKQTQTAVELSIVAVIPDIALAEAPVRVLAYASTALNIADNLRRTGINSDTLRILSPCHIYAHANGGDLPKQLESSKNAQRLVERYKEAYFPKTLNTLQVTLDTGKPVTQDAKKILEEPMTLIKKDHPDIVATLASTATRYQREKEGDDVVDSSIVYLLAHPEAWGYDGREGVLFDRNGQIRVNIIPASELQYLEYMKRIEGEVWTPGADKQIATVVAAKHSKAPYFPLKGEGWVEPSIKDLAEPGALQGLTGRLRRFAGHKDVAGIIDGLNQLNWDVQQAQRNAKLERGKAVPFLDYLIKETI